MSNSSQLQPADYQLTFWAHGMNFIASDMALDLPDGIRSLYTLQSGFYQQYIRKDRLAWSSTEGARFYGDPDEFVRHRDSLKSFCADFKNFFEAGIQKQQSIDHSTFDEFVKRCFELYRQYSKMDFEYTDAAFSLRLNNPILDENLKRMSLFKDEVRAFLNTVFFEKSGFLDRILGMLEQQFDRSRSNLELYTFHELSNLFDGKKLNVDVLKDRSRAFVGSILGGERTYFSGDEATKIIERFEEKIESTDILRGKTANKGMFKGRVKIMKVDYSNLEKLGAEMMRMPSGSVLVAETTAPELMLACKKAGAIVTDIGGLMSHAAIVSRELNIPCLVGTKNASKILKDGDEVEVDATSGVVRILKRA